MHQLRTALPVMMLSRQQRVQTASSIHLDTSARPMLLTSTDGVTTERISAQSTTSTTTTTTRSITSTSISTSSSSTATTSTTSTTSITSTTSTMMNTSNDNDNNKRHQLLFFLCSRLFDAYDHTLPHCTIFSVTSGSAKKWRPIHLVICSTHVRCVLLTDPYLVTD